MLNANFFINLPVTYKKVQIYPPKIKDVLAEHNFNKYVKLLTISQEELEDEITENGKKKADYIPTPMEFLLGNSYSSEDFKKTAIDAFYYFFHEKVTFLYEQKLLVFGDLEQELTYVKDVRNLRLINEEDYFELQNIIRDSIGENTIEKPNPNEDPRIKKMKAKARYRDKIKAKQGGGLKLEDSLASICCMGIGITPLNIGEMSYAAISVIMNRYQEKEKYETDIKSIIAGADSKKIQPKYWIRNLDNN